MDKRFADEWRERFLTKIGRIIRIGSIFGFSKGWTKKKTKKTVAICFVTKTLTRRSIPVGT